VDSSRQGQGLAQVAEADLDRDLLALQMKATWLRAVQLSDYPDIAFLSEYADIVTMSDYADIQQQP
jgi:hypothetical protein